VNIVFGNFLSYAALLLFSRLSPSHLSLQLSSPQIFLSHDWPQSIEHYGDLQGLLRRKRFLRQDIESGSLGSPPLMGLLNTLKPDWWFAAHLHARYEATVVHGDQQIPPAEPPQSQNPDEITIEDDDLEDTPSMKSAQHAISTPNAPPCAPRNPNEILLDDEEEDVDAPPPPLLPPLMTRFLALDKCLPNREYLEVIYESPKSL